MPLYCFECGVEVPEEKKLIRHGRVFCSPAHARTKRKEAAPPQVKPPVPAPAAQSAPVQGPPAQPSTPEAAPGAPSAVPTKPPQS
jgi:hypothetical protein